MEVRDITVTLELRLSGDALAGCVQDEAGVRHAFCGWLGLVAAIDELVGEPCPATASARTRAALVGTGEPHRPSETPDQEEGFR